MKSCGDQIARFGHTYECDLDRGHAGNHKSGDRCEWWEYDVPNKQWKPNITTVREVRR